MSVSVKQAKDAAVELGIARADLIEALRNAGADIEVAPPTQPGKTFKAHRRGDDKQLDFITTSGGWYICWFGIEHDAPVMYTPDEFMRDFEVKQ